MLKHLALLQLHILTVPASISHTYHGYTTTGKHAGSSLHFSMAKNDARVAEIAITIHNTLNIKVKLPS